MDRASEFITGYLEKRRLSGSSDDKNTAEAVIFQIIFYSLFVLMLIGFYFVFKRNTKTNQ